MGTDLLGALHVFAVQYFLPHSQKMVYFPSERNLHPPMRKQFKIVWNALLNAYDAAFMIVIANVFAVFFGMLVITAPLAVAGLFYTNFQLASGESVEWKTFFEGIKRYWWPATRWTVLNAIVLFSLRFYYYLFIAGDGILTAALLGLTLGVMAIWTLLQFFTFPMMLEQEKPGLFLALRNSLIFLVRWPTYCFAFLLPALILGIASLFFPPLWIFISISLIAFLGCYAVHYRIDSDRHPELYADPRHENR